MAQPSALRSLLPPLASPPDEASFPVSPSENRQRLPCLPTYFSRCEETNVCSENTLSNLGKGATAWMAPAALDPGQRRPGQAATWLPPPAPGRREQPIGQALIPESARELCMHPCFPQNTCSLQLDGDPPQQPFIRRRSFRQSAGQCPSHTLGPALPCHLLQGSGNKSSWSWLQAWDSQI